MSLYVSPGYIRTSEAVGRVFQARHPGMAASAPARETELWRLDAHFRAEFPDSGAPPARLADAVHSWEAKKERLAADWLAREEHEINLNTSWDETPARLAEAKQRYADIVSARWSGTFTDDDLARLHELKRVAREERKLHEDSANQLRSAFAEGHLATFLSGDKSAIDRSLWHEGDALMCVFGGQMDGRAVVIREADFMAWLHSGAEASGAPGSDADQAESTASTNAPPTVRHRTPSDPSESSFKVIKNVAGGGGKVRERVANEMYDAVTSNSITLDEFRGLPQLALAKRFGASRSVVVPARKGVLAHLKTEADAAAQKKANRGRKKQIEAEKNK
jgi:hypothetical protein